MSLARTRPSFAMGVVLCADRCEADKFGGCCCWEVEDSGVAAAGLVCDCSERGAPSRAAPPPIAAAVAPAALWPGRSCSRALAAKSRCPLLYEAERRSPLARLSIRRSCSEGVGEGVLLFLLLPALNERKLPGVFGRAGSGVLRRRARLVLDGIWRTIAAAPARAGAGAAGAAGAGGFQLSATLAEGVVPLAGTVAGGARCLGTCSPPVGFSGSGVRGGGEGSCRRGVSGPKVTLAPIGPLWALSGDRRSSRALLLLGVSRPNPSFSAGFFVSPLSSSHFFSGILGGDGDNDWRLCSRSRCRTGVKGRVFPAPSSESRRFTPLSRRGLSCAGARRCGEPEENPLSRCRSGVRAAVDRGGDRGLAGGLPDSSSSESSSCTGARLDCDRINSEKWDSAGSRTGWSASASLLLSSLSMSLSC